MELGETPGNPWNSAMLGRPLRPRTVPYGLEHDGGGSRGILKVAW